MTENKPTLFTTRQDWRDWLEKNHDSEEEIWLLYYKKHSGKESVTYEDAVEEALCFGWIDSQVQTVDAGSYMQRFSRRKKNSVWSESNKERVVKLIGEGCMTEAGIAAVREAKQGGHWDELVPVDSLEVPSDLEEALAANPKAAANFEAFSASQKKMYLFWVQSAKTEPTRKKRIKMTVKRAAKNKKWEG
ncbi:MAG: YdeI/OmpD-associated family protein [Actinobacteria bacterium]|nr:YdeI/OmpD-associated family protein [Actinomycetota bacterium]MCL5882423.1 YdeI/OmpD-associated family protein [Actinomycetota bacterium]